MRAPCYTRGAAMGRGRACEACEEDAEQEQPAALHSANSQISSVHILPGMPSRVAGR